MCHKEEKQMVHLQKMQSFKKKKCLRDDSVVEIGKVDNKTDVVVKGKEVSTVVWTSGDISDIG